MCKEKWRHMKNSLSRKKNRQISERCENEENSHLNFSIRFPNISFFFCYFLWTLKFVDIGFCLRAKTPASEQHSKFESENKTHLSFNCVNLRKKSGFDAVLLINNDYCRPMCVVRTFFTVIRLPVPFIIFTSFVFSRALDAY